MNKANKANFPTLASRGWLIQLTSLTNPAPVWWLVVDGFPYMVNWEQGQTWQEIADRCLSYVQCLGRHSQKITVVFDSYNSSSKDHDHIRCTKNFCCNVQIQPDMILSTPRANFMGIPHKKGELIQLLSFTFRKHQIVTEQAMWQWCWHFNCESGIDWCNKWLCWGQHNSL